ncbi:MAG: hypothetical protein OEV81_03725 [Betaproteobacteria bacterium]|nr:hypothetical protein [Betaproteobacteria bacterium]MDH5222968.1 hypothetical protein [Betaproteobacteria bacterium]MDH5351832.1 hypothetical protein [Betaproteobacteria bacterium]
MVRHLREGTPLESSGAGYLANMRVMQAAHDSHRQGRRIELGQMR